jgi:hypothetical protein
MDIVSETKAEFRLRQWTKIIQECQASNLTVTAWCSQHNIGIKTYYYWLRKIRLTYCQPTGNNAPATKQEIVPLQFQPQSCSSIRHPAVTIHLGTALIDIAEGTSQATIEAVLISLQNVC